MTDVFLTCARCGHAWHAAVIPDGWTVEPPEKVAARCYCAACDAPPPHRPEFLPHVALEPFVCGAGK